MFERRNIKYIYLKLSRKIKDFLLSDKSREFLIFLFFFPQFSGLKENKILIKYRIPPRLFILFMLILVILMH